MDDSVEHSSLMNYGVNYNSNFFIGQEQDVAPKKHWHSNWIWKRLKCSLNDTNFTKHSSLKCWRYIGNKMLKLLQVVKKLAKHSSLLCWGSNGKKLITLKAKCILKSWKSCNQWGNERNALAYYSWVAMAEKNISLKAEDKCYKAFYSDNLLMLVMS
jgi:hypothetical protein